MSLRSALGRPKCSGACEYQGQLNVPRDRPPMARQQQAHQRVRLHNNTLWGIYIPNREWEKVGLPLRAGNSLRARLEGPCSSFMKSQQVMIFSFARRHAGSCLGSLGGCSGAVPGLFWGQLVGSFSDDGGRGWGEVVQNCVLHLYHKNNKKTLSYQIGALEEVWGTTGPKTVPEQPPNSPPTIPDNCLHAAGRTISPPASFSDSDANV